MTASNTKPFDLVDMNDIFQEYVTSHYPKHHIAIIMRTFLPEEARQMLNDEGYVDDEYLSYYGNWIFLVDPDPNFLKKLEHTFRSHITIMEYDG